MKILRFSLITVVFFSLIACGGGSSGGESNEGDLQSQEIPGLIAHYSFDEGYGNMALDGTSNKIDGIITAASRVEGKIGNGLLFGTDDSYVTVNDGIYFDNGLITIEAWIKLDMVGEGEIYRIIGDYNYHGFYLQIRDGKLEILYDGQSYHYGTASIQAGVWTHMAFTSDGTNIITYINGVEDGRTNITLPVQNIFNIRIGANRIYTGGSSLISYIEEFPGMIDELRIWDIARSQDEIAAESEKQLIVPPTTSISFKYQSALYNFDELSGNIAFDTSGNKHDGIITAASRVEGKIGNGLLFGTDDSYVTVNDGLYFDNGLITIEAWIKPDIVGEGEIYRIIGDYNYHGFYLQIRDGKLEILYDGQSYHYGTASIQAGVWTHMAFTSDGTNIITYIDGVEDGRTNITLPVQNIFNIRIGANRIYTGGSSLISYIEEFPGIIDELRLWDGVCISSEILEHYNSF